MTREVDLEALRATFSIIAFKGEGILLNRITGTLYRVNSSALAVWTAMIAGESIQGISAALVRRFGLDSKSAEQDTLDALLGFPAPLPTAVPDCCVWKTTPNGYGLFDKTRLVCEVASRGESLVWRAGVEPSASDAFINLNTVVPKLLALRGIGLLHASAVDVGGTLLVFCGKSGAGKTTSARAFARTGCKLVSEDLLVLATEPSGPAAVVGGEPVIRRWLSERKRLLAARPDQSVTCGDLDGCLTGERIPLGRLLLLDAERRQGSQIAASRLATADAMAALTESAYFASTDATTWEVTLQRLASIARAVPVFRATMPSGLAELGAAAAPYKDTITS